MKLLHIAECAGGVDRYLRLLLPLLESKFKQVLVCSQHFSSQYYLNIVDEIVQMEMDQSFSLKKIYQQVVLLRSIFKKEEPDIIYCHSSFAGGIGRLASFGFKHKIVYNPHGWAFNIPYGLKPKFYILLERVLAYKTDKIIAISDFEKQNAIRYGIIKDEKIDVIYSGIDLEATKKNSLDKNITRKSLGIPDDAFLVGMSARICETKAPDIFVEASAIIKKAIPNAFFILIGDGELRIEIEKLIKEKCLVNCVTITGWVENPLPYIKLLDVGLLLSRWEGFGLALVEYMKLGIPIVATRVCAIPNLITNDYNGLLVDMDNYKQVAEAVIKIYKSKKLREKMITNGVSVVNTKYDIHRVAMQHLELFSGLLENK
jgi:glycosyltransferase involved in cell wall biosynthesis